MAIYISYALKSPMPDMGKDRGHRQGQQEQGRTDSRAEEGRGTEGHAH